MAPSSPDDTRQSEPPNRGVEPHEAPSPASGENRRPSIWLVLGDKPGDNAQAEVVADALPWPVRTKRLVMRAPFDQAKPRVSPSLHHIDPARSDPLEPPWPDLVVTVGRRPSMAALWIRAQSGGKTKIVQIGKPSGRVEWYDLVIAGAEVVLPPLPNVLTLTLPLMQVDAASLVAAAEAWRPRLAELPRPLIGCLIGGPTEPYVYDSGLAERLIDWARGHIAETGGTPYLTTSRRTPADLVAALRAGLPDGARLFAWAPEASDNPYHGLLALADGLVVTGDSISMMVEALKGGKPVAILPLRASLIGRLDQIRRSAIRWLFAQESGGLGRLLYRLGIATQTRDFDNFHRILQDRGLAGRLGGPPVRPSGEVPDELPAIIARIERLLAAG